MRRVCLSKPGWRRASSPIAAFAASISEAINEAESGSAEYVGPVMTAQVIQKDTDEESEPRFTFRVVGTSFGDRQRYVNRLGPSDPFQLAREPLNTADENAIGVLDRNGNHLGYLKREVAEWFAPTMDRGATTACVYRLREDGTLIAGVYDH